MSTAPEHIDELIASYLTGEATPEDRALVEAWRRENEANNRYFEQSKLIFELAATAGSFDTDRAWQKLRKRLPDNGEARTIPLRPRFNAWMRAAAGLLVLITAGIFAYNYFGERPREALELLSEKQVESDTLPDGSAVVLNRQSRITYVFEKDDKTHIAKLEGEAYFNINHDDQKRFIVEAEGTFIRDIGTSFNVKAYPGSPTIEVVVEEGEVVFYTQGNPGIYLKANGKGIYNKETRTFTVAEPEANVTAYKTRFFSFSNHSLATVVETLNSVYEDKIVIGENLNDCKLTVSFNDETPDEIAGIIAETLGLSASRSGKIISLTGTGCGLPTP